LACPSSATGGGNFVCGYDWLDGVGPSASRPHGPRPRLEFGRNDQFGTNEFLAWCRAAGTEPLLGLNFGTGNAAKAAALVEYCNVASGTKWSDLHRRHGVEAPWTVRRFWLGNEMDGTWQIGHMTAVEYGRKAADAARQMRAVDRGLQLVACGSSGPGMATYLDWDRIVLEECYDVVKDDARFLASNVEMERQTEEVVASAITSAAGDDRPSVCGCRLTNGTSGTGRRAATDAVRRRRVCSKRSTTFATPWSSGARSTR